MFYILVRKKVENDDFNELWGLAVWVLGFLELAVLIKISWAILNVLELCQIVSFIIYCHQFLNI